MPVATRKKERPDRFTNKVKFPGPATTDILDKIKAATPKQGLLTINVTSAMARDIMMLNDLNRPVKAEEIDELAEEMRAGKFKFTGETIKISKSLKLLDGQHRLWAQVKADVTIKYNIQCGIDDDTYDKIDAGRKRTAGDTVAVALNEPEYKYTNVLAMAIRNIIYYTDQEMVAATVNRHRARNIAITGWMKNETDLKRLRFCVDYTHEYSFGPGNFLRHATWAFVLFLLIKKDKESAIAFINALSSGANINSEGKTSPIFCLRNKLISLQKGKVEFAGKKKGDINLRYIMRAWNHYRNGEKIKVLKIDFTEPTIEKPI